MCTLAEFWTNRKTPGREEDKFSVLCVHVRDIGGGGGGEHVA